MSERNDKPNDLVKKSDHTNGSHLCETIAKSFNPPIVEVLSKPQPLIEDLKKSAYSSAPPKENNVPGLEAVAEIKHQTVPPPQLIYVGQSGTFATRLSSHDQTETADSPEPRL